MKSLAHMEKNTTETKLPLNVSLELQQIPLIGWVRAKKKNTKIPNGQTLKIPQHPNKLKVQNFITWLLISSYSKSWTIK